MDGNGRWAKNHGLDRIEGHRKGSESTEKIITHARERGIPYLTLYAFSKENWLRPPEEVAALMSLLEDFLVKKKQKMLDNEIALNTIGDTQKLPERVSQILYEVIQATSKGKKMVLTLALSYGARDEMIRAIKKIQDQKVNLSGLDEKFFSSCLDTHNLPDPDLIIRTSGESRISNFLLWQGAYSEYYFENCLWPDFGPKQFDQAIEEYQSRERRYGKTSEQL